MRRYLSILLVIVLTLTIFTACGKEVTTPKDNSGVNTGEPISITFWHHESPEHRVAAFQRVIDMYTKEHPNVSIKQEVIGWGDAMVKVLTALEAGNPPDFQFGITDLLITTYRHDALLPVTDLIEEFDKEYKYYAKIKDMYFYDGEYWGVPVMTMPFALAYRPSILEKYLGTKEPPKDWNEMLDYAKRITVASKGEVYGIGLGGGKNLFVDEQAYMFLASAGGRFFDEKGNIIFNSPETIKFLKAYKEMYQYSPPGSESWVWGEIEMNLSSGIVAMAPYLPSIQIRMNELNSDDLAFTDMPTPNMGDPKGSLTYPNDVQIFKKCNDYGSTETVKDFVRFIMKPDVNANLTSGMEPGGFLPVTKAAAESGAYWNNPIIQRYLDVNKVAVNTLDYSSLFGFEYGKWVNLGIGDITGANVLSSTLQQVLSNQKTPEEAAAWGAAEMKKMSIPVDK